MFKTELKEFKETKKRIMYHVENNIFLLIGSIYVLFVGYIYFTLEIYQFIAKNNNLQLISFDYSFFNKGVQLFPICIWIIAMHMKKYVVKNYNKTIKKLFYWLNLIVTSIFGLYIFTILIGAFFLIFYSNSLDSAVFLVDLLFCFELYILMPIYFLIYANSLKNKFKS